MKTVQTLRASTFWINSCKNWKQTSYRAIFFSVMIRNLWLIMATYCLFVKCYCLNCNNSYNICLYVKCVKIGCLLSWFILKGNVKTLLQNNCINSGVTNDLKWKKQKKTCKTALKSKMKESRETGMNG